MSELIFCCVLRGKTIIASLGHVPDKDVTKLLPQDQKTDQKIASGRLFSFIGTPGLVYCCVGPQNADKQRQLLFLETLSRRWAATYGQISSNAESHALDNVLAQQFGQLFDEFAKPISKTADVHRRLDETEAILNESVSKALGRGGDLQAINAKSEDMMATSEEFRKQAANVKRRMRCSYYKSWIMWVFVAILVIYYVLTFVCGGYKLSKCL